MLYFYVNVNLRVRGWWATWRVGRSWSRCYVERN